jgi:ABC-type dipeptide/oligopeptide/nickel transport system permease component
MRLWIYVVRRALLLFPVIIGVMTITFALVSALPLQTRLTSAFGVPPRNIPYTPTVPCSDYHKGENGTCPNTYVLGLEAKLGLNRPIIVQWGVYIWDSLTFNWGHVDNHSEAVSTFGFLEGETVLQAIGGFLPYTLELAMLSLGIVLAVSIPLGNLGAVNRNRPIDQASRVISFSGYALPAFLLGGLAATGAIVLIAVKFGSKVHSPWCPAGEGPYFEIFGSWPYAPTCYAGSLSTSGYPLWMPTGTVTSPTGFPTIDALIHHDDWLAVDTIVRMILPALVIAYGAIAGLLRFVRNSMLEVMNLDYVRTARAKGVPESLVVRKHAGRNSLNVTVTVLGLTFAFFIGGFPVIEAVFNLWGVGRLLTYAIDTPIDYGLVFGSTLLFTYLVVFANLIVDVTYAILDPRVRLG